MARYDQEGYSGAAFGAGVLLCQVVEAEDVVGCADER